MEIDKEYYMKLRKETSEIPGAYENQEMDSDYIEIGIDVDKDYRNTGIATELVKAMIQTAVLSFPGKELMI